MANDALTTTLAQPFVSVNTSPQSQPRLIPDTMIHHKVPLLVRTIVYKVQGTRVSVPYGVSSSRRVLSPQLLLKRFDQVKHFLERSVVLPRVERQVVLSLVRLYAYYGAVYPKQAQISLENSASKATYWRAIRRLRDAGLITVVNRFIIRPHAQISNLYKLDKLLLMIARYLAEHGQAFAQAWLQPYLAMPGAQFWDSIWAKQPDGPHHVGAA